MINVEKIMNTKPQKRFAVYAWIVVIYTIAIILWGAFVRATGSGAGCGSHWPTCHGEVIPRPESIETIIEYTHRITSAILGPMVIVLWLWGRRLYGKGSAVSKAGFWTFIFVLVEGGLGAGLVLFELVAHNISLARAFAMGVHLINTLILLGFMTFTAWWASGRPVPQVRWRTAGPLIIALLLMMVVGAFGAITAMGDTLFPAESFAEGAAAKFDPSAHFAVKMRLWHPVLAVGTAVYLSVILWTSEEYWQSRILRRLTWLNLAIVGVQLAAGVINVLLAAPIFMQLLHLALADIAWMSLLFLMNESLAERPLPNESEQNARILGLEGI